MKRPLLSSVAVLSLLGASFGTTVETEARPSAPVGASTLTSGATATPVPADDRVVTLVGDLQTEVGCETDWDPACAASALVPTEPGGIDYRGTFDIPAGTYEYKVALDGGWDESHPQENLPLVLQGPAELEFRYDAETHDVGVAPTTLKGDTDQEDAALAGDSLRESVTDEQFYFVMADRFANGDESNDTAGLPGDRLDHGFDPTDKGFFHGGDLAGIEEKLDYIQGLGTTAIWLTPSFKNKPVQGTGADASAGYHGYWVTDFTRIDPHLGTNEEMAELIDAAHARGMKVYFDIITNHTADVIDYEEGEYSYVSKEEAPYTDADGTVFDDADYAGGDTFPEIDVETSFPYTPVLRTPEDADVKVPAWLNDPQYYHNRGDTTWAGESTTYGDFIGLDDLWTERPEVVDGMIDVYSTWADMGIDGFRIDTVKHVNMEFWQEFSPAVLDAAREGNEDFFMFGEVFDGNPQFLSQYTTTGRMQAIIDFGFQGTAVGFAGGSATTGIRDFYAQDDYYTDTDSNAYQLPTFLGNHDMGRASWMLASAGYEGEELQERVELANALMFLTRGQPVVYYGDEQGFIGSGGDKDARQDMFATQVEQYAEEPVIGAPSGSMDRYDTDHPLYQQIAELGALRAEHPALADGAQIHRYASNEEGVFAVSRIDAEEGREYLVVLNNGTEAASATFDTFAPRGTMTARRAFTGLYGAEGPLQADASGRVSLTLDPLSVQVYRAARTLPRNTAPPTISPVTPLDGSTVGGRGEVRAAVDSTGFVQTTMAVRPVGTQEWTVLGTDDNAPFRVFHDVTGTADGTLLEYRMIARDHRGQVSAVSSAGVVGPPGDDGGPGEPPGEPIVQPDAVSAPGSLNSEMGCAADWDPACDEAQLALDPSGAVWTGTWDLPAGDHEYKAAIDRSWDENYGQGGVPNGPNIPLAAPGGDVTFYYDHATHWITTDVDGEIITAPGSLQSELGCAEDWMPDCLQPWLQDPDGDGLYTWSSTQVPAGNYAFKVAHGLSWDENYGEGGVPDGPDVAVTVPRDGVVLTLEYDLETHVMTWETSKAGVAPDLTAAKAHWLTPSLLAWPADALPPGADPSRSTWRLHTAPDGGLAVDAEDITGGTSVPLTRDPDGLPEEVLERFPHLQGYFALRLDDWTAGQARDLLRGQVAVGLYDDLGRVADASGVQVPGVLDALYADDAAASALGATWDDGAPTLRLWAPTAQDVTLLTWPADAPADATIEDATEVAMTRSGDGTWSASGDAAWDGARYLYRVEVFVPATGAVETNVVTDPYSVALTLDSTRSVLIDLDDPDLAPQLWQDATPPALQDEVDQSIYEVHVRDFSMSDPDVPEDLRGSYLAFAEDGAGRRHLEDLAGAGLNTVHLLPTFDIASIPEDPADTTTPDCDLESFAPDGTEQQACVKEQSATDGFNWGYDPWHFMAPEGSYTSSAETADGGARVVEFRTMVGGLHESGLRVVLDQVFNHTAESGQGEKSVLDKVVPGYYHRLNAVGAVETSTCCQNVATEHAMAQKLMVDAVVLWARDYKVDGFRFDLMGHHSVDNMLAVRAGLDDLTLAEDGVDGSAVTLYGEGWNFGEVADNARFLQATQGQLGGTSIATFSDRLRDAVRGGAPFDEDPRQQGFGSGGYTDPNGAPINGDEAAQRERLRHQSDLVMVGLAGNLADYRFRSARSGELVSGADVDYNGAPAGYATAPDEVISYVDAHDNETLFDSLYLKLPQATSMEDRVRMNTLSLATSTLGQSPVLWHAGADLLRSKSLDRNSYDSGDWFNVLDFTQTENGFARGLPPAGDNEDKWGYLQPLLADAALVPEPEHIASATAGAQALLRLRYSSPLFRLGDAELIEAKVSFPVSGTDAAHDGVVVMRIDDTAGASVDPDLDGLVVVLNGGVDPVEQVLPGLEGAALALSPIQQEGADDVVRTSTWDADSGTLTVPARTVAVFVEPSDGASLTGTTSDEPSTGGRGGR